MVCGCTTVSRIPSRFARCSASRRECRCMPPMAWGNTPSVHRATCNSERDILGEQRAHAFVDAPLRLPARGVLQLRNVGEQVHALHLAHTRRLHLDRQLLPELPLEGLHDLTNAVLDAATDVEGVVAADTVAKQCVHR